MHLLSVNVVRASPIQNGKPSGRTGIYKLPVTGPTEITREGLDGDDICDSENHGGVDQAVYIYGAPDYEWWSKTLGANCDSRQDRKQAQLAELMQRNNA